MGTVFVAFLLSLVALYYTRPKWHERESCHLEKLLSKRNSNYRNAPNTTHYQVSKCHFPAKKYNPYKIYQKRKHAISIHDFFSKRSECQGRKFKGIFVFRCHALLYLMHEPAWSFVPHINKEGHLISSGRSFSIAAARIQNPCPAICA